MVAAGVTLFGLLVGAVAAFLAGILRGFSGFGVALSAVPLLSLAFDPRLIVPNVMLLQLMGGLVGLGREHRHIEWPAIGRLLPAAAFATLPGLGLLLWLEPDAARLGIGLLVSATALLLARGYRLAAMPRPVALFGIGGFSGVLGGFAAIPGPPVIALFFALGREPAVTRATLAFYFLCTGAIGLATALWSGVIRWPGLWLGLALLPGMLIGQATGSRLFDGAFRRHYRRVGLALLLLAGIAAALRGGAGLWLW